MGFHCQYGRNLCNWVNAIWGYRGLHIAPQVWCVVNASNSSPQGRKDKHYGYTNPIPHLLGGRWKKSRGVTSVSSIQQSSTSADYHFVRTEHFVAPWYFSRYCLPHTHTLVSRYFSYGYIEASIIDRKPLPLWSFRWSTITAGTHDATVTLPRWSQTCFHSVEAMSG